MRWVKLHRKGHGFLGSALKHEKGGKAAYTGSKTDFKIKLITLEGYKGPSSWSRARVLSQVI